MGSAQLYPILTAPYRFDNSYGWVGISHCGIYVGDGWMLHCGDPISYANLNTSYWQSHFYAYGKMF